VVTQSGMAGRPSVFTHVGVRRLLPRWPRTLVAGGAIVLGWVAVALLGPALIGGDPLALKLDAALAPPGPGQPFGTDNFGRDIFTRVVYGAALDLQIGIFATLPSFVIGSTVGVAAGYYGKRIDALLMRLVDILTAFPFLVLVIAIVAVLGPGIENMYIAVAVVGWITYARLARSSVQVVRRLEYVSAARAMGFGDLRIMVRHVWPNIVVQSLVLASSEFAGYILLGSSLGYLGLGVLPPQPEWGVMIADGRNYLVQAPWMTIFPGLVIVLVSAGCLLIGEGLADVLRPELRGDLRST
jgi:peptide/nickel transport system permease protein